MEKHICKICGCEEYKKNGFVSGFQRYKCKNCGHQYIKTTDRGKPIEDKLTALDLYNFGVSKNFIAHLMNVTAPSVCRWIGEFQDKNLIRKENEGEYNSGIEVNEVCEYFNILDKENPGVFYLYKERLNTDFEIDLIIKDMRPRLAPSPDDIAVCAFGDSVLRGVVRDSIRQKYEIIKNNLLNIFDEKSCVSCKNYAKHGSTVLDGDHSFDVHLSEVKQSDYVFLLFGGNECNFNWDEVEKHPTANHQPACPVQQFQKRYSDLINKIKKQQKIPVLFSLPPINAQRYFDFITRTRSKKNILKFLCGDVQVIYRWHEMYNLAIFKIAMENNVRIVDITSAFLEKYNYWDYLCEDGIHPNEKGHALIAKIIRDVYKENSKF